MTALKRRSLIISLIAIVLVSLAVFLPKAQARAVQAPMAGRVCSADSLSLPSPGWGKLVWFPGHTARVTVSTLDRFGCRMLVTDRAVGLSVHRSTRGTAYTWSTRSGVFFNTGTIEMGNPRDPNQSANVLMFKSHGTIYAKDLPRFISSGRVILGKVEQVTLKFIDYRYA